MPTGNLVVSIRTANSALPIGNTTITITDANGAVISDDFLPDGREGLSREVEIEAPNVSESLEPQGSTPYTICNVTVTNPNFYTIRVRDVQIFAQTISELPIKMIPLEQAGTPQEITYVVPENNLRRNIVPNRVFPPDSRILAEVYIPQFITVHLGAPDDPAQNVTVTFVDYIKNVASSEIYPTWPEESIRANILCQISLALNRIYTEWYTSRGYPFNITSSTSFDQFFVYGRNIFDTISNTVDEIFNSYIIKPGRLEPYFAEYCNGTTVSCPGLSQWGTVSLAEDGLSAEEILEFYYGPVEIVTTNDIRGITGSYPGYPLRVGSTGTDVRIIQQQLNRIAINYPSIPVQAADGVFGSVTQEAVESFQRAFLLTADGIVGKSTWYRISYIYAAVKKLGELNSEGDRPIYNEYAYPGYAIRYGSVGTPVQEIQFYLQRISVFNSRVPSVTIDGRFGDGTLRSVREFQEFYDLTPDGIVGELTWDRIVQVYIGTIENVPSGPDIGIELRPYPGTLVRSGQSGSNVLYVQQLLNDIGEVFVQIPVLRADSVFGAATQSAVRIFQGLFGLTVDGIVGERTWNKLNSIYVSVLSDCIFSTLAPGTIPYPGTVQRFGSAGDNVTYIQNQLNTISAILPQINRLTVDGRFGAGTERAVTTFQRIFGLSADGQVGTSTWTVLNYVFSAVITDCLPAGVSFSQEAVNESTLPDSAVSDSAVSHTVQEPPFPFRGKVLRMGSFGDEVFLAKKALCNQTSCDIKTVGEHFLFGAATRNAVMRFQKEKGLEPSGVIDEATWNRIFLSSQIPV